MQCDVSGPTRRKSVQHASDRAGGAGPGRPDARRDASGVSRVGVVRAAWRFFEFVVQMMMRQAAPAVQMSISAPNAVRLPPGSPWVMCWIGFRRLGRAFVCCGSGISGRARLERDVGRCGKRRAGRRGGRCHPRFGCGTGRVSFLIADLSGRALVRLAHMPLDGGGTGRRDGEEVATVVPFDGGPAEPALRTQTVQVLAPGRGWTVLAPVSERGEMIGLLELVLPAEPEPRLLDGAPTTTVSSEWQPGVCGSANRCPATGSRTIRHADKLMPVTAQRREVPLPSRRYPGRRAPQADHRVWYAARPNRWQASR